MFPRPAYRPRVQSATALRTLSAYGRPQVPVFLALAWLIVCYLVLVLLIPISSLTGFFIRLFIVASPIVLLWFLYAGGRGGRIAITALLVLMVAVSDLSIRARDLSDTSLDAQNLVKLAIWGVGLLVALLNWSTLVRALREPSILFFVLFAVWGLITAIYSPIPLYSFGSAFALLSVLAFGAVARFTVPSETLLRAVIVTLTVLLWCGLILYATVPHIAQAPMEGGTILRLARPFGTPNQLGSAAAITLLLVFLAANRGQIGWRSPILLLSAPAAIACLVLSQSRTSLLALVIALLAVFLVKRPRRALFFGAFVLLVLMSSIFLGIGVADIAGLISRTGYVSEVTTLTGRTSIWSFYLQEIAKEPLLGYGYASSKHLMPLLYRTYWGWTTTHAHNMWIQVAFTTGIVGLALLTLALVAQFWSWFRTRDDLVLGVLAFMLVRGLAEAGQTGAGAPGLLVIIWAVWLVGVSREVKADDSATRVKLTPAYRGSLSRARGSLG